MYRVRFEVNGLERWLTSLHYEYFHPVSVDPEYYRQFLKKNFPYEPADALSGYPYNTSQVPLIKHRLIDEKIAYDCRKKLSFGVQAQGLESRFDTMLDPMEPDTMPAWIAIWPQTFPIITIGIFVLQNGYLPPCRTIELGVCLP